MSLEKFLVSRDLLDAYDPNAGLELDDPIHKQEWISMRQDLLNSYRKAGKTQFAGSETS